MQRQDMNGARTPQDIERKYDLVSIGQLKQNFELHEKTLTKVENENNNILKSIIINLEGILESQSEISLWFFSGIPTLGNSPYIDWENPNEHIGDIYYDKETGNTYIFKTIDGEYLWELSTSFELMRAMALSNAQVKIGNERKVFLSEPITPYQNGDWYLKDNDLYICQVARSETEKYSESDFIIAVKYTDDTYAIGIGENLTILSGTVTEIKKDVDELETTMTNTTELVDEQGKTIGTLAIKQSETSQTVDEINSKISNLVDITLTAEDNDGEIEFEGVASSLPLKIIVKPILNNITTLYPSKNIYPTIEYFAGIEGLTPSELLTPSEDLTPKFGIPPQGILYPQKRTMTFENTKTSEIFLYDLPADLLYYNSQFYDEFILDYVEERCVIVKRVGQNPDGTVYVLPSEQVIEYEYPDINLTEGNYIINVGQSPSYISATVLAKNDYTDYFATKVEMHTQISQTANAINLEVSKKLDGEEFTGANIMLEINKDTSQATINADKVSLEGKEINLTSDNITIESNNFSVDSEGNMACNNAIANELTVNGGDVNLKSEGEISKLKIIDFENNNCISQMSARRWLWEGLNGGTLQIWNVATSPVIGLSSQSGSETTINAMGITTPQVIQTSKKEGKKNFEKFEKALSKIKEVDIYKYNLKDEKDGDKKHIGLVIGEEYNYLNDIIATDENGKEIGVNLYSMISLCLQAIKEQQGIIEDLQKRVEKLERKSDK